MKRGLLVGLTFLCLLGCDRHEGSAALEAKGAAADAKAKPASSALRPADKTLDQILAAYAQARGGKDRLLAIKTLRMTGKMTTSRGIKDAPVSIERKREGDRYLRRMNWQGTTSLQVVDGAKAWEVSPRAGVKTARVMPDQASRRFRHWTSIEGPLVDPKGKGDQLKLLGIQKLDSGEAYRIQVRYADGDLSYYLLDTKTFLPVQVVDLMLHGGDTVEAVNVFKDFRKAGGVVWPFEEDANLPGMQQTIKWDRIETDVPIADAGFKMPAP
jgi:hypothetical protein